MTPDDPTPSGAPAAPIAELTERERAMIELERSWWTLDDSRDLLIRARFSCSIEDYYRELNQLLDHPGALAFDPLVVRRLRRQRDRRRRARIEGPNGVGTATGRDR